MIRPAATAQNASETWFSPGIATSGHDFRNTSHLQNKHTAFRLGHDLATTFVSHPGGKFMTFWQRLKSFGRRLLGLSQKGKGRWHDGKPKAWELHAVSRYFIEAYDQGLMKPGDRCLDIGCGEGHSSAWMAERGLFVLGVDLMSAAIEKGRARYGTRDRLEFRQADATQAMPELGEFDAILDRGCLHVIPAERWPGYFQNIAAWLKPGGVFLLQFRTVKRAPEEVRQNLLKNLPPGCELLQQTPIDMFEGRIKEVKPGVQYLIRRKSVSPSESDASAGTID